MYIDAAYCYQPSCVVQYVTVVSATETAESMEMQFG